MPRTPVRRGLRWGLVVSLCVVAFASLATAGERTRRRQTPPSEPPPIESILLMEAQTGAVLFEKDIHKERAPASMVKMMLMLIVMEKLHAGELHLSETITATAHASKMGGCERERPLPSKR